MADDDERQLDAATRFDEERDPTRRVEPARDIPGELFEWAPRKGEVTNANHA